MQSLLKRVWVNERVARRGMHMDPALARTSVVKVRRAKWGSHVIMGEACTCEGSGREPRGAGPRTAAAGSGQAPLCVRGTGRRPWRGHRARWPLVEAEASVHGGYLLLCSPEG